MDTTENNKLIAEFMELESNEYGYINNPNSENYRKENRYIEYRMPLEELRFDTSWDWLMPVVEKIETLETDEDCIDFDIYSNAVVVETTETKIALYNLSEETFTTKLESTYKAVIDAINWINQNAAKENSTNQTD